MDRLKVNRLKVFFGFFVISLLLTLVWFRGRSLLGGGEASIPFYDLARIFDTSKNSWIETNLGSFVSIGVSAIPFYWVLSKIQGFGVSGYLIEAAFFLVMVDLTLVSMYLFSKEVLPKIGVKGWVFASLFYLFNLYSLANIWNRFLLNFTLFYSIFPLAVLFFLRGLKRKDYRYSIIIALGSVLFSYAFSSPVSMLIFWGIAFLLSFYYFFFVEKSFFIVKFFIVAFMSWFLLNFWWISQNIYFGFSQSYKNISGSFFTQVGNLETLDTLSNLLGRISNLFLLKHGTFFTFDQSKLFPFLWPLFYNSTFGVIIEWVVTLGILLVAIIKRKEVWVKFLFILFIFALFVSKGNSIPFGALFDLGFQKFSFIQFFRNPYEKLGILLSFSISPLFGLMVVEVFSSLYSWKKRVAQGVLVGFGLYVFVFLGFPYFTGLVFTSGVPPTNNLKVGIQVDVPSYYKDADNFLKSDSSVFRYLTFPLGGEGIFYNWSKGYAGVELSPLLLGLSGISNSIDLPYYKQIVSNLERIFRIHDDFYKIAGLLNIKYLILRPDIDFSHSAMRDPGNMFPDMEEKVDNLASKIDFVRDVGPLKFYKIEDSVFQPKVYAGGGAITTNQASNLEDLLFLAGGDKNDVLLFNGLEELKAIKDRQFATVIHTDAMYRVSQPNFPAYSNESYIFPYVNRISSSSWYPFILLREKMREITLKNEETIVQYHILLLGKRLIETQKAIELRDYKAAQESLRLYTKNLDSVISEINGLVTFKRSEERTWHQDEVYTVFNSHLYLLNQFKGSDLNKDGFVDDVRSHFRKIASDAKILPLYDLISTDSFPIKDRSIYKVYVREPGEYEINFPKTLFFPEAFGLEKGFYVQVDNNIERRVATVKGKLVSFGKVNFSAGIHEIGFNQVTNVNLVDIPKELGMEAVDTGKEFKYPFPKFDPYSEYQLSLNYITNYGKGFTVSVKLNNDYENENSKYFFSKNLGPDGYFYDFRNFTTTLIPRPSSDRAELILNISPWNNCNELNSSFLHLCLNPEFRKRFDRPSKVILKDLAVTPRLPKDLLLINETVKKEEQLPEIKLKKVNSSKYEVSVRNATGPFMLVFSELYDSNWKAYFADSYPSNILERVFNLKKSSYISDNDHLFVNGYANAWVIDKRGDYDMVLEFWPQNLLYVGSLVSGASVLVFIYLYFKRK